jgi:hypothetical protein
MSSIMRETENIHDATGEAIVNAADQAEHL